MDKNPLAVELCKVALWLEAHNPGEPLNFLDHHIKCGDAIVGLAHKEELENGIANEAFKKMPDDDKDIRAELAKRNKRERKDREQRHFDFGDTVEGSLKDISKIFDRFNRLPENTIDEIEHKRKKYEKMTSGANWMRLKTLADIQVAQFFIPKDEKNVRKIVTDEEYMDYLSGIKVVHPMKAGKAGGVGAEKRFFHYFLEFPEVFAEGGFDCILGNPPYLGGKKISGAYGDEYLNWLNHNFKPVGGSADLVVYFLRRIHSNIKMKGFLSVITTNSIYQGDSRKYGLDIICSNNGDINMAVRSIRWPGIAALEVSLLSIANNKELGKKYLDGKEVAFISPYFDTETLWSKPYRLHQNKSKCFMGSNIVGNGFFLTHKEANKMIEKNKDYKKVIFKCYNGNDLNNSPSLKASRAIINLFDFSEEKAKEYSDIYDILSVKVYPERMKKKQKDYRKKWWQYGRKGIELYNSIKNLDNFLVMALTTRHLNFSFIETGVVITHAVGGVASQSYYDFLILQSTLHFEWARKYSSTLATGLRYTPSTCFESFPFPQNIIDELKATMEKIGKKYYNHRKQLMIKTNVGLTKTYNLFHARGLSVENIIKESKQSQTICEEAYKDILTLRQLHKQMNETVLKTYGWEDIDLNHDFYEVDYLPENDRIRYTISTDARKEVLKRLLKLNHEIHEQEVKAGLHLKRKIKKKKSKKKQKPDAPKQISLF